MNIPLRRIEASSADPVIDVRFPTDDDWLDPAELAALTPATLRARTMELKPMIAARARDTELARRPLDAVWNALRRTGIFYHFVPKRYGGLEFGFEALLDIMLPIAEACASTGWVSTFCVEHNYIFAQFPRQAQDEVFASQPYIIAPGTASPPGKAVKVPGGYRISGRWKWGSGVMNADWIMAQAAVVGPEGQAGPPEMLYAVFPAREVEVTDTWHMAGMAGTGSNDFAVTDLFVPEHRLLPFAHFINCDGPGALSQENPMYRAPIVPFTSTTTTIPALGAARAAVDFYRDRLPERLVLGTQTKMMDKQGAQLRLARGDLLARNAEMLVRDSCRTMQESTVRGDTMDDVWRRRVRAQNTYAVSLCRDAIQIVTEASGAGAQSLDVPIQRYQRDCNMVLGHALYDADASNEQYGRALLGLAPNSPMF